MGRGCSKDATAGSESHGQTVFEHGPRLVAYFDPLDANGEGIRQPIRLVSRAVETRAAGWQAVDEERGEQVACLLHCPLEIRWGERQGRRHVAAAGQWQMACGSTGQWHVAAAAGQQ